MNLKFWTWFTPKDESSSFTVEQITTALLVDLSARYGVTVLLTPSGDFGVVNQDQTGEY